MLTFQAVDVASGRSITGTVVNGKIARLDPAASATSVRTDVRAQFVAPAFFDVQINGGGGIAFSSDTLTVDQVRQVASMCHSHGIGCFLPTLITNSFDALRHGMETLRRAIELEPQLDRAMPGIHLEGPYLSAEDGPRGAHPREHIRPPNRDEFKRLQEAAGGRIRLVTLAPETENALEFIEWLCGQGLVVAIGHTAASPARIREAIAAGARLSTHLGNGCHLTLPRHDNYLWEQLAADLLWASLIADGHHLPPAVFRCLLRAKTPARTILTCDASSLAGLPPGSYRAWGNEIEVLPGGKTIVLRLGVSRAVHLGGVSLADAVAMATDRPRQLLGLPLVRLEAGQPADLVFFDMKGEEDMQVRATLLGGERVFAA